MDHGSINFFFNAIYLGFIRNIFFLESFLSKSFSNALIEFLLLIYKISFFFNIMNDKRR